MNRSSLRVRALSATVGLGLLRLPGCASSGDDGDAPQQPSHAATSGTPIPQEPFDYAQHLELLQRATGITDPPETQLVRVIAPDEQAATWQACMNEAGFDVVVTPDGGMGTPVGLPDEQSESYELADYLCHAQFPVDQSLFRPFGEDQVRATFDYYVDVLAPCLRGEGYAVAEAPTWNTFRDSWTLSADGGLQASDRSWTPYDGVDPASLAEGQWDELNLTCPQSPPRDLLFPDS